MRSIFSKIAFTAALMLAITFTFSCSAVDDAINGSSSSSGGSERNFSYCITASGTCLQGPYTAAECNGTVSNSCPSNPGGSSPSVGSSSSVKSGGSSSTVVTPTYSLDGVWISESGLSQITVSGSTGVYSVYPSTSTNPLTQSAIDKGYVGVGKQYWRNITSTGTLTWSGQEIIIQYYTSNPNVAIGTDWINVTFTMSADGQTLTVTGSTSGGGAFTATWTRKQ